MEAAPHYGNKVNPEIRARILTAAEALVGEGIDSPTNDQVRERLGGGSLSHISPVMREWRDSRKAKVVATLEMPLELRKALETSLSQLWSTASKLASSALDAYRVEAENSLREAQRERDEALAEIQHLETRLGEQVTVLQAKAQQIEESQATLAQERADRATEASESVLLRDRLADRENQLKELKSDLKTARSDLRNLQDELVTIAKSSAATGKANPKPK